MVKKKRQSEPGENGDDSTESCDEIVKSSCPHVTKAVNLTRLKVALKTSGFEKECSECSKMTTSEVVDPEFEEDHSLWMCLRCGTQLCGRARNEHALKHFGTPRSDCHALTVNTTTWIIFCYNCNNEVTTSSSKKLHECVEYLKKQSQSGNKLLPPTDLMLKPEESVIRTETFIKAKDKAMGYSFPRVRGLTNLGNTCFFNSVMQCLVQTPYLLNVLQEMSAPGEKFTLPGGKLKVVVSDSETKEVDLPPITGELAEWGGLTRTLAETLSELQSGDGCVFTPNRLLSALVSRLSQFGGGDQHDSHELLRHMLEAVRSEDLKRYQSVILKNLGLHLKVDPAKVDGEVKQIVKFYGQQASDTMLRPEQVFRGFLVSTLECQECLHHSDRAEYFLDLSLPVAACRPQPPAVVRRKTPNEELTYNTQDDNKPSKHQIKKERAAARKAARKSKGNSSKSEDHPAETNGDIRDESKSSSEESDADVEDNVEENSTKTEGPVAHTADNFAALYNLESGYNSEKVISSESIRTSPVNHKEKSDSTPEDSSKDFMSVAIPLEYRPLSNADSGVASPEAKRHSEENERPNSPVNGKETGSQSSLCSEVNLDLSSPGKAESTAEPERPVSRLAEYSNEVVSRGISMRGCRTVLENNEVGYDSMGEKRPDIVSALDKWKLDDAKETVAPKVEDTPSYSRGGAMSLAARYVAEEDECSVQSCLSQFTALELLTGNNKVGCETCTERINGKGGKTVYTNATKRFLVSSPPAILILHLKRFQLGPRCIFRKMAKHVDFPTVLDLAPFCAMDKLKKLPNVMRDQNELLYSLYGVVEHSGSMHGGHYVAYVKVRPKVHKGDPRWWFLPKSSNAQPEERADSESDLSGYESGEGPAPSTQPPPGKWFYVSDSMVSEVSEEKVLRAQAYLLFYERIQ